MLLENPVNMLRFRISMNRLIGFFILFFLITTFAHGQEEQPVKTADAINNWISGGIFISYVYSDFFLGIDIKYERMFGNKISLGTNFYWGWSPLSHYDAVEWSGIKFGIDVPFRYYPWGKKFFIGTALGFGYKKDKGKEFFFYREYENIYYGLTITPELGWKFYFRNTGGFFLQSGLAVPIFFGKEIYRKKDSSGYNENEWLGYLGWNLALNICIGYAF